MFTPARLKIHLKLAINRIKLIRSKREALSLQNRRAIATLLGDNKIASATIRVEGIIRDDDFCEALEILELYCELLLARFGLVEASGQLDSSIEEAVHGLVYSAARCGEIKELTMIRDQLAQKVGKEAYLSMLNNGDNTVNPRLVLKLGATPPHNILVERYLAEIAQRYGIPGFGDIEHKSPEKSIELISLEDDQPSLSAPETSDSTKDLDLISNTPSAPTDAPKKTILTLPQTSKSDLNLPTPPKSIPTTSNNTSNIKPKPAIAPPKAPGNTSIPSFEELESRFNALKKT